MNKLSKILIIPVLIAMVLVFSMSALAVIHTKWVAGDFIYYDESDDIFAVRDDEDGVRVYDDMDLTFGDGDDATIEWDEDGTDKLIITCASGFTISGAITLDSTFAVTLANPVAASNALYGLINAGLPWATDGNLVGVRGKVVITAAGTTGDATGVWAGIEIKSASVQRFGLQVGMNVEAYSDTICLPNAVVYIQSLPSGASTDFSDVPYLVFSETRSAGATGSNILFEVGHSWANTIPEIGEDELFYNDTLRIAVNEGAGSRTPFFIPLSTDSGTFTTEYPIVATYGSGLDVSASAIAITITDPLIDTAAEYIDGVYAYINSTDAVGWSQGEVVAIRGFSHLATTNPGEIVTSYGGKFTLEFDSTFTATGLGCTAGAYIGVENQYAGAAPTAVLYIEEITSGTGDARNMPMVIMTSQAGETADKSPYAFSFGFAAAGTTVGSGTGEMFEGNTIQCIINGTPMFIPFSTVEASFTTAYPIASTDDNAIGITSTFDPDTNYTDYALAVGFRNNEIEVTFDTDTGQNLNLIQMNVNAVANVLNEGPTASSQMNLMHSLITHDSDDMTNLRLKCADFNISIGEDFLDAYIYQGQIDLAGDASFNEAALMGLVANFSSGTVTGSLRGLIISIQGSSVPAGTYGIEVRNSAATTEMAVGVYIDGQSTITTGLQMWGTITNAFVFQNGAGVVHGGASAANVMGYVKIKVGSESYRIPYLDDTDT